MNQKNDRIKFKKQRFNFYKRAIRWIYYQQYEKGRK